MENNIKPYEISLWKDTYDEVKGYYKEEKIMVIGSNTMKTSNRAFSPTLKQSLNGETTLEFSILYKVYNEYTNIKTINPFIPYLINERKIKLKYGDGWFDFILKEKQESSDNTFTYTAVDANILELSKKGYGITLSTELKNNQGTVIELGKEAIKGSNWEIDEEKSEKLHSYVDEPVYKGTLKNNIEVYNMEEPNSGTIILETGQEVYLFYSQIKDKKTKDLQLVKVDENFTFDDNGVAKGTNYRCKAEVQYDDGKAFPNILADEPAPVIFTDYQIKRLVRNQKTLYDKTAERVVDVYQIVNNEKEIYHYQDTIYTTSDVLVNYIANSDNFELSIEGGINGWKLCTTDIDNNSLMINTYPSIAEIAANPSGIIDVRNYFTPTLDKGKYIYNSGIQGNRHLIKNFVKGEIYSFKIRAGQIETIAGKDTLVDVKNSQFRIIIAPYTEEDGILKYDENHIIFNFSNVEGKKENIIISNGSFYNNMKEYKIDGVTQIPNPIYYYQDKNGSPDNNLYRWDANEGKFVMKNEEKDLNFYRYNAVCQHSVSDLVNNELEIGIFLENISDNKLTYHIESIQFFKYIESNGVPMMIGETPNAESKNLDYYYFKPDEGAEKTSIDYYSSIEDIGDALGINREEVNNKIIPKFDEDCQMVSMIEANNSNHFDILQNLCEKFECWMKFDIEREDNGAPKINEMTGRPSKKIIFKKYIGKDNYAGFKYGINLKQVERTVNSEEIVTKLIVPQSENQNVDGGVVTIRAAESNVTGLSYILNFNYFIKQGLLDSKIDNLVNFYDEIGKKNKEILEIDIKKRQVDASLLKLETNKNVFSELLKSARNQEIENLEDFQKTTNTPYDTYIETHTSIDTNKTSLLEYITNIKLSRYYLQTYDTPTKEIIKEYNAKKIESEGYPEYNLEIIKVDDKYIWSLNDYVDGIKFKLKGVTEETIETNFYTKSGSIDWEPTSIEIEEVPNGYIKPENRPIERFPFNLIIEPENKNVGYAAELKRLRKERDKIEEDYLNKFGAFIQEGTWNSNDYIDNELYYLDAVKASYNSGKPKVEYSIDVIEISGLEEFKNYEFKIGDKTYMEDTEFFGYIEIDGVPTPVKEEVVISEITHHLDSPEEDSITVKNYKTEFEDLFQRLAATTQSIQYREGSYARAASAIDVSGIINPEVLLNTFGSIGNQNWNLTNNGIISITGDGIVVTDIHDANRKIKITSCAIKTTVDDGATWINVLTPDGLETKFLKAGIINTDQILIMNNEKPAFRWDKTGLNALKYTNNTFQDNTFVRLDQYGLYGIQREENDKYFVPIDIDDVENNAIFGLTWNGFFLNSDHGAVKISSKKDIQVFNGNDKVKIHIGRIEEEPEEKYGIRINDNDGNLVLETDDDGDLALAGLLSSISYKDNPSTGWAVNGEGNAIFNNITARGAIKTAVFEYAEIQAVGGVFLFRPSTTIKNARRGEGENINDIIVTVDNPLLFAKIIYNEVENPDPEMNPSEEGWYEKNNEGKYILTKDTTVQQEKTYYEKENPIYNSWCKISNYLGEGTFDPTIQDILEVNGLTHIYKVKKVENKDITLEGAAAILEVVTEEELIGGSLVDMGREDGSTNYGIGVNSSDNSVALPPRSISLFETKIDPEAESGIKVSYDYKAVLGTLPPLGDKVNSLYETNMIGTQGLYTDNLYLGDKNQYIMFYSKDGKKSLRIKSEHLTLENGQTNDDNYLFLSDETYEEIKGTGQEISIAGSDSRGDWRQIIGKNFGVTEKGELYANGASIAGTIYVGERNTQPLNNIVEIGGGGISLGDPNKFHIFIGGKEEDKFTYGLGFYVGTHEPSYIETVDSEVDENKKYYEFIEGEYIEVTSPSGNPREKGWYEQKDNRVAYINSNKLSIPYTVVLRGMEVGKWIWELQEDTNNLTLKWQGGID